MKTPDQLIADTIADLKDEAERAFRHRARDLLVTIAKLQRERADALKKFDEAIFGAQQNLRTLKLEEFDAGAVMGQPKS